MDQSNQLLGTEHIGKLMQKYAIPCVISLLVGALYNIVDQIFIANATYLGSYGNAANTVVFPLSGPLSQGLRATGDVKFTMIVSIASTVGGRLVLSIILALGLHLGVIGIALAMCGDWTIRAIIFYYRYKSNAWTEFEVI